MRVAVWGLSCQHSLLHWFPPLNCTTVSFYTLPLSFFPHVRNPSAHCAAGSTTAMLCSQQSLLGQQSVFEQNTSFSIRLSAFLLKVRIFRRESWKKLSYFSPSFFLSSSFLTATCFERVCSPCLAIQTLIVLQCAFFYINIYVFFSFLLFPFHSIIHAVQPIKFGWLHLHVPQTFAACVSVLGSRPHAC